MDLREVRSLGEELLAAHGLSGWHVVFDGARRRAGSCRSATRTISLSRHLMALYDAARVRETILHEVAHALVGPAHGHDEVWRAQAVAIGGSGARLVDAEAPRAPAPWVGTCPRGHRVDRHRRPGRPVSCSRCDRVFNTDFLLTWTWHGRRVRMGAAYEHELAHLHAERERRVTAEIYGGDRVAGLAALWEDEPADADPPPWWESEVPGMPGPGASWVEDGLGRRWHVEDPPTEITDPPTPARRLAEAAALGALAPGWRVRITAPGKYEGRQGTVVKSARTRYHVRTDGLVLTVPFPYVEALTP